MKEERQIMIRNSFRVYRPSFAYTIAIIKKNAPVSTGMNLTQVPLKTVIRMPQQRKMMRTVGILKPFCTRAGQPLTGSVTTQHTTPSCARVSEIPFGSGAICDPTAKTKNAAELKQETSEINIDRYAPYVFCTGEKCSSVNPINTKKDK